MSQEKPISERKCHKCGEVVTRWYKEGVIGSPNAHKCKTNDAKL